jgi:hypothetical protein
MIEIKKLMNEFFIFFWRYRAIKLICNRVIHAFESVCRYLNYTLDLLYKRKIKRQLKSGKFKIRFYCQKIRESSRKIRLFYSIIVTINAENVLHVVQSTNESNSTNDISQHTWIIINFVNFFSNSEV